MDPNTLAIVVLVVTFVGMLAIRIPVSFCLLLSSIFSALACGQGIMSLIQAMAKGVCDFNMLAIPFFIVMGEFMNVGGMSERVLDLANLLVGRFKGGLAYINVLSSMMFGHLSGSAVADVSSLGSIVVPMMKKQGYDDDFAVGLTVTTACQGVLIPPSHNMVLYALAADAGGLIAALLYGGLVPGVLLGINFCILVFFLAKMKNFPKCDPVPKGQRGKVVLNAILPLMIFVIIMGGIGLGLCTATEAASIACIYTFVIVFLVLRTAKFRVLPQVLKNALKTLATVLTLIAAAKAFSFMMTYLHIPQLLISALGGLAHNRVLLLLVINVLLLLLGCFMDMAPLILIMTPILLPVVQAVGMNTVHFGVMMIFNLACGLCTPPVGTALFVGCAIGKTPIERTSRHMLPLYAVMIVTLLMVTFIPGLSTWLPTALHMM